MNDNRYIDEIDGEWELDPEQLASIFHSQGWEFATPTLGYGPPSPDVIVKLLVELANYIFEDGRPSVMANRGRFLAIRHEDSMSVDLYLNVGYFWPSGLRDDEFGEDL